MDFKLGAKYQFEKGSWLAAANDVGMGVAIGVTRYFYYMLPNDLFLLYGRPICNLLGIKTGRDRIRAQGYPTNTTLKVAAIGYGRTGTMTLYFALDQIGFTTYHSMHMPELADITSALNEDIFLPSIRSGKVQMNKFDFKLIVSKGYDAVCDQPMAHYYEQIMEEYPDCKFILTTRQSSEIWFKSWITLMDVFTNRLNEGGFFWHNFRMAANYFRWLQALVLDDESYLTRPYPFPTMKKNKAKAIASYEAHNQRVREVVPADRLLEFRFEDGWEPLCKFLEIDNCPTGAYPRSNSSLMLTVFAVSVYVTGGLLTISQFLLLFLVLRRWVRYREQQRIHRKVVPISATRRHIDIEHLKKAQ